MSLLSITHSASRGSARGLVHAVTHAVQSLAHEWSLRRASAALEALDDAMLTDIGVARGDIDHAVRHGRAGRA